MGNLTSSLTVKLIDDVSKPARTVSQALEDASKKAQAVAKAMAGSGATDKFTASLSKLKVSAKDIDQVAKAWKQYASDAKLAATASEWTKDQASGVKRWESQTISALKAVEREQARFARASKKAMEPQSHGGEHGGAWSPHGALGFAARGAAAAVTAHSIFHYTEEGLEAGAERQHVRVGMRNAGMTVAEIKEMESRANVASKEAPNLSVSEIMELGKEARSAVQHPKEAVELLPMLAKASSVLRGMGADNNNIAELVKAGESLGLMGDVKRFKAFLDGQVKAMAVMGKTIDTAQIYEAAKYSKSAGAALSDRFLNTVMPSLIQEMHGSSAGDALSMLSKTIRGGLQHKHLPVERLNELGMLEDPSKIKRSKTGQIMGYKGKVAGEDLLATDPDKFAHLFNEHMEAHGIHSLQDKVKTLYETLPSTAANLIRILIQQEETLKQHAANYNAAPGTDEAAKNQLQDPVAAVGNLTKAFNDLGAATTSPGMKTAGAVISSLAGGIRALADAAKDHPIAAMTAGGAAAAGGMAGAGYLSYQLLNGFGLKPAATELSVAAKLQLRAAEAQLAAAGKGGLEAAAEAATGAGGAGGKPGKKKKGFLGNFGPVARHAAVIGTVIESVEAAEDYLGELAEDDIPQKVPSTSPRENQRQLRSNPMVPGNRLVQSPSPYGDLSGVTNLKTKADEAKESLDQLNTTVAPVFNGASLDAYIAKLNTALGALRTLQGAGNSIPGMKAPSLGALGRGSFTPSGDPGR